MDVLEAIRGSALTQKILENKGKLLAGGLIAGAAYAIFSSKDSDRSYLSASALGKRGTELEHYLSGIEDSDASSRSTMAAGDTFHKVLQSLFSSTVGAKYEVPVVDKELGVKGRIDVLLDNNVPVEIKTISSKGIERLSRPLESHESQLNFYLHARKASYGYVLYVDSANIQNTRAFQVGYSPGRLIADVQNAKEYMALNPTKVSKNAYGWLSDNYANNMLRAPAIRNEMGTAASFDSIKPTDEFPGGRANSLRQASNYYVVQRSKNCNIPTMGLTIRNHETAIGHKSRSKGAKINRPAVLYNGSRRYR